MLQMFNIFKTYVAEVLRVATLAGACGGGPCVRAGSEAGVGRPYLHAQQQAWARSMRTHSSMWRAGSAAWGRRSMRATSATCEVDARQVRAFGRPGDSHTLIFMACAHPKCGKEE